MFFLIHAIHGGVWCLVFHFMTPDNHFRAWPICPGFTEDTSED